LLRRLPAPVRAPFAVAIAYLDMLSSIGRGGERSQQPQDAPPPALAASAVVVWKGRAGRALIVSDRREPEAIVQLRRRSLWSLGAGVAILCYGLLELINLF
jgi:hypothetical protein